ncbi:hypothetical protein [uncultured Sphingomonas sp.]|uniref:hypothetical protein n=1 Tax=uncultured Sphingomonas sp. TaxID=158754 RepID=UPI0035CAECF5
MSIRHFASYLRRWRPAGSLVCHETNYHYVCSTHGRCQDLRRLLPCARRSRRPRYGRKPRGFKIPVANTIAARPPEVAERRSFDHWRTI